MFGIFRSPFSRVSELDYFERYLGPKTTDPVSSSDLRFERTCGQPPETASINLEPSRSMLWVTVSFTASSTGSISMVQRDQPSALSSGLNSLRQRMPRRFEGSNATISPASPTRPSGNMSFHDPPSFQSATG